MVEMTLLLSTVILTIQKKNGKTILSPQLVLIIIDYFTLDKNALFVQKCCIIVNGSDKSIISQDRVTFLNFPSKC